MLLNTIPVVGLGLTSSSDLVLHRVGGVHVNQTLYGLLPAVLGVKLETQCDAAERITGIFLFRSIQSDDLIGITCDSFLREMNTALEPHSASKRTGKRTCLWTRLHIG